MYTVLQISALQSLTSLLSVERVLSTKNIKCNSTFSLQKLCDDTMSPRNSENINPESQVSLKKKSRSDKYSFTKIDQSTSQLTSSVNMTMNIMVGEDLCRTLLRLYELQTIENNNDSKRKGIIVGTLSSLLNISKVAKKCALDEGFLYSVLKNLKRLHVDLSLHSAESLRKTSEKKKVFPFISIFIFIFFFLKCMIYY